MLIFEKPVNLSLETTKCIGDSFDSNFSGRFISIMRMCNAARVPPSE
jgi:hypothetical protein